MSANQDSREGSVIFGMINVIPKTAMVMESVLTESVSANQDGRDSVVHYRPMNVRFETVMAEEPVSQDLANVRADLKENTASPKTVSTLLVQDTESASTRSVSVNQDGRETTVLS